MDAKAVQAFFAHGGTHDCSGVARLSMAEGLIKTIGADNFDALYDTSDMPWVLRTNVYMDQNHALHNVQKGDWLVFWNQPDYSKKHKGGWYRNERVIAANDGCRFLALTNTLDTEAIRR